MDDGPVLIPVIIQIILIILNAVFAAAEATVLSVNGAKFEKTAEQGSRRAKRLVALNNKPERFLFSVHTAITLTGFLGSAFAAECFSERLALWMISLGLNMTYEIIHGVAVILITLIMAYLMLVFGELLPKKLAVKNREGMALSISGWATFVSRLFVPFVAVLNFSVDILLRCFGIDPNADDGDVTEDEIRMLVETGGRQGVIDEEEKDFIENLFEFDDLTAEELVTHRTDVVIVWAEDDISEWEKTIHQHRFTRYLVCGESEDDVLGVLDARDYFRLSDKSVEYIMKNAVKPAYFVPKSVGADVLFHRMRRENQKLAVVLDEYGGLWGIITLIDLVEELVGELGRDDSPQDILRISADTWQVYGSTPTRDVYEELGIEEKEESTATTFGGLILEELGSFPEDGTCPELEIDGFKIKVNQVSDHRIGLTTVQKINSKED